MAVEEEHAIKFLPEYEKNSDVFGIFIDDNEFYCDEWLKIFKGVNGFTSIVPRIEGEKEYHHMYIQAFRETYTPALLQRVAVVAIDQFRFDADSRERGQLFLNDLRNVNQQAWVVETSAAPTKRPIYAGSNTILDTSLIVDAKFLINKTFPSVGARVQAFKYFTVEPFLEAQFTDPKNKNKIPDPLANFSRLVHALKYKQALELINIDRDAMDKIMISIDGDEQLEMLHCLWDLLGHLSVNHAEELYSGTLSRLKNMLQAK